MLEDDSEKFMKVSCNIHALFGGHMKQAKDLIEAVRSMIIKDPEIEEMDDPSPKIRDAMKEHIKRIIENPEHPLMREHKYQVGVILMRKKGDLHSMMVIKAKASALIPLDMEFESSFPKNTVFGGGKTVPGLRVLHDRHRFDMESYEAEKLAYDILNAGADLKNGGSWTTGGYCQVHCLSNKTSNWNITCKEWLKNSYVENANGLASIEKDNENVGTTCQTAWPVAPFLLLKQPEESTSRAGTILIISNETGVSNSSC